MLYKKLGTELRFISCYHSVRPVLAVSLVRMLASLFLKSFFQSSDSVLAFEWSKPSRNPLSVIEGNAHSRYRVSKERFPFPGLLLLGFRTK